MEVGGEQAEGLDLGGNLWTIRLIILHMYAGCHDSWHNDAQRNNEKCDTQRDNKKCRIQLIMLLVGKLTRFDIKLQTSNDNLTITSREECYS